MATQATFIHSIPALKKKLGIMKEKGLTSRKPLPTGTMEVAYLKALNTAGNKILEFGTQALIVASGFDTFKDDPLSCFELDSSSYYTIGRTIRSLKLPTLFVQEGGYLVAALRENVRQLVVGFESL